MSKKIKVSDYIVKYLEELGVGHVFLISGGGNIHLVDSIGKSTKIKYVCNHHEQACAIAAEGYSRVTGNIGVCIVTTGPGGTNTLTGVLGAWQDSIPLLVISGQVKRELMGAGKKGLRQLGDQEINIVDIVKPITKYAWTITEPKDVRYHLEKAIYLAKSGRQGPVWIDIPLDIQSYLVGLSDFRPFSQSELKKTETTDKKSLETLVKLSIYKIKSSHRPVLYVGNGVKLAHASKEILELINLLKIPVLTSFVGYDLVSNQNPYFFGRPGIVGQRAANFVLQNSDLFLSIGSRLNIRSVGYNYRTYARGAFKIIVDIDKKELHKKTISPDLAINCDAKDFIQTMIKLLKKESVKLEIRNWIHRCSEWNRKYPVVLSKYWQERKFVNSYCFIEMLSRYLKPDDVLVLSNGTACVCTYQALNFPQGMKIIVNSGCAAMGYGLPAAIGACFAHGKKSTICIEGDGSIQMNIHELQTIIHHSLPIKIFVYNNDGYLSIRATQINLFGSRLVASDSRSGVSCPDMIKIAKAYGIRSYKINNHEEMKRKIKEVLQYNGPVICEVMMSSYQQLLPRSATLKLPDGSFVSKPLEDMYPFLNREEFKKNMIIPPLVEQ